MKFKASVCVCSHNRPRFLKEALQSLLDQTMQDFEVILIENSTEEPDPVKGYEGIVEINAVVDWFREAIGEDRLVLVNIPRRDWNTICPRWNMALDISRGEYFCTLDDDNKKLPEFLEKLSAILDADPDVDIATCHNQTINENGEITGLDPRPSIANKHNMRHQNFIDSGDCLYRKDMFRRIGYWDENCITHEDWDLLIRAYWDCEAIGRRVQNVPEILAHYRLHGANRIYTSNNLGGEDHCIYVKEKAQKLPSLPYKVAVCTIGGACTQSQKQVTDGYIAGIKALDWVQTQVFDQHGIPDNLNANLILVIGPFMIEEDKMLKLSATGIPICTLHMEDPQAHIRTAQSARYARWIVTNDESTLSFYRALLGDAERVFFLPALLANPFAIEQEYTMKPWSEREFDVAIVGHPYRKRKEFISQLTLPGLKVVLVGGNEQENWRDLAEARGWQSFPTLSERETYHMLCSSKVAILRHREVGELGYLDETMPPISLQRGFLESYCGCYLLTDRGIERFLPAIYGSELYTIPLDVGRVVMKILNSNTQMYEWGAAGNRKICQERWTYPSRMQRLLNWIRSPRKWTLDSQLFNNAGPVRGEMPKDSPAWKILAHPLLSGGEFECWKQEGVRV